MYVSLCGRMLCVFKARCILCSTAAAPTNVDSVQTCTHNFSSQFPRRHILKHSSLHLQACALANSLITLMHRQPVLKQCGLQT